MRVFICSKKWGELFLDMLEIKSWHRASTGLGEGVKG